MPDPMLTILLDQNIPVSVADWLRSQRPSWNVRHVNELGFQGKPDDFLYRWAQGNSAIVITFAKNLENC